MEELAVLFAIVKSTVSAEYSAKKLGSQHGITDPTGKINLS